jgi:predicted transcriptional regulator
MGTTLRVSEDTRNRVAALAESTGRQMQVIVEEAVAAYERALFWEDFESGWERLAGDPAVAAERRGESPSLHDGS